MSLEIALERIEEAKKSGANSLNLSGLGLEFIPKEIKELKRVEKIDLSHNCIKEIENLDDLIRLRELNLVFNIISEIKNLDSLINLEVLNLGFNKIKVIENLNSLKLLNVLNFRSNHIDEIKNLDSLTNLNSLYLQSNEISVLENLENLTCLKILNLGFNKIKVIENLNSLVNLMLLYLNNNKINIISNLEVLRKIRILDFHSNQITLISSLDSLVNINSLDLRSNQIMDIQGLLFLLKRTVKPFKLVMEKSFWNFKKGQINLYDNPISIPPISVINQNSQAVLDYFEDKKKYGLKRLFEAKLLVVGEPNSGKTTLCKKLLDEKYNGQNDNLKETLGVQICKGWTFLCTEKLIKNTYFRCNIWDFGGQEKQYPLHQYFLTERAIYALVSDDRADNRSLDKWFSMFDLLGGKSSKLIFILNQINRTSAVSNFNREKYENLGFEFEDYSLDLLNDAHRLKELTLAIQKSLSTLTHIGEELPSYCITIRDALEKIGKNYITYDDYEVLCEKNGLTEEGPQRRALRYLNDVGSVVYYENDTNLATIIILNPHWVIDAMYAVITNKELEDNQGRFDKKWLFNYWKQGCEKEDGSLAKYKGSECNHLLQLMLKDNFDICYELKGSDGQKYLLPLCMPENLPKHDFEEKNSLQLLFRYEVMPPGLVTRLIVRLSDDIDGDFVCKNAVILKNDKRRCRAKIEDYKIRQDANHYIRITVIGDEGAKIYLERIKDELLGIQKGWFENLIYEELIPCYCKECKENNAPHSIYLSKIKKRIVKGKEKIECPSGEDVNIYQLLGDVYRQKYIDELTSKRNYDEGGPVSININTGNYNKEAMKIENLNITGGQVNFADRIDKIVYNQNTGMNSEEFAKLIEALKGLEPTEQNQVLNIINVDKSATEVDKQSRWTQFKEFMMEKGIAIGDNVAAGFVFEGLKTALLG